MTAMCIHPRKASPLPYASAQDDRKQEALLLTDTGRTAAAAAAAAAAADDAARERVTMSKTNRHSYSTHRGEPVSSFTVDCEALEVKRLSAGNWAALFSEANGVPFYYTRGRVVESCRSALEAYKNGVRLGAPGGMPYIVEQELQYFDMLILTGFDGTSLHVVPEGEGGNL